MPEIDKIEKEKRIRSVTEWIIDDFVYGDLVQTIMKEWTIEERQAQRYIKEAREHLMKMGDEQIEVKRRRKIESLKKLKHSLKPQFQGTPDGIAAIMKIEKQLIMLEGLEAPRKMELSGPDGQPLKLVDMGDININMLSTEALLQLWAARKLNPEPDGADSEFEETEG